MDAYLRLFFQGPEQALALAAGLIVFAGLAALGRAAIGRSAPLEAAPLAGWSIVVAFLLAGQILFGLRLSLLAWVGFAATGGAFGLLVWRRQSPLSPLFVRAVVVALPLLALASAHRASEWDEFSHWTRVVRYLFEKDALPTSADPDHGLQFSAYPFAFPLLNALASRLAGTFLEGTGAVFNVLLLLGYGALAVRLAALGASGGATRPEASPPAGWFAAAFAVAAGTALNPSFVQKIVLTNYAETATGVVAAFAGVLAWMILNALAERRADEARALAWSLGLVVALLVNVKQVNVVIAVLIFAAAALAALRDPAIGLGRLRPLIPGAVLPPLLMYFFWRIHVTVSVGGGEAGLLPFEHWVIDRVPQILARMALIASKKGVYFGLMLVALALGLRALVRCRSGLDRFALVVAVPFLGYNAFLLFAYVAHMGEGEGTRAASFWRYNMHLALLGAAFFAYLAGILWRRFRGERALPRAAGIFVLVLVVALPLALAPKLRFDRDPPKPHYRAVAAMIAGVVPREAQLVILDPAGSGESGIMTAYHLRRADRRLAWISAHAGFAAADARGLFVAAPPDYVLVHSGWAEARAATGLDLREGESALLRRTSGGWSVVGRWPYPGRAQSATTRP